VLPSEQALDCAARRADEPAPFVGEAKLATSAWPCRALSSSSQTHVRCAQFQWQMSCWRIRLAPVMQALASEVTARRATPKLWGAEYSVYTRIVRLVLAECEVKYERVEVDIFGEKEKLPADYITSRHPFSKIPAFEHGENVQLFETDAIVHYIVAAFPPRVNGDEQQEDSLLLPAAPAAQARCVQIMRVMDNYAFKSLVWGVYVEELERGRAGQLKPSEILEARKVLEVLEGFLPAAAQPFFLGETLTLADLWAAPMIAYLRLAPTGAKLLTEFSKLEAWFATVAQRLSMKETRFPLELQKAVAIRKAAAVDCLAIAQVATQAWAMGYAGLIPEDVQSELIASDYAQDTLSATIASPSTVFLVACDADSGSVLGYMQMELEGAPGGGVRVLYAHMHRLYILPRAHRRGVGSALLQAGLAAIRAKVGLPPTTAVLLSCSVQEGAAAHNFYQRLRFVADAAPLPGLVLPGGRCPALFTCGYTRLFDPNAVEVAPHPVEAAVLAGGGPPLAKFLDEVLKGLEEVGLLSSLTANGGQGQEAVDHVCYRSHTSQEYAQTKAVLSAAGWAECLVESAIGGRSISTWTMDPPLTVTRQADGLALKIRNLELPAPKAGRPYATGLEHLEVVVGGAEAGCVDSKPLLEAWMARQGAAVGLFDTLNIGLHVNADVSVQLPGPLGCVVKFHSRPLDEVIAFEKTQPSLVDERV
jgi:glutathione S-transferase